MRIFLASASAVSLLLFVACSSMQGGSLAPPPLPEELPGGWTRIQPVGVNGLGSVTNDPNLIINGNFLDEHTVWNDGRCVTWTSLEALIIVDLGRPCTVAALVIQLATANDWVVSASTNGLEYTKLMRIRRQDFRYRWGMETVSSIPGSPDSFPGAEFQPVEARYIKIQAVGSVFDEMSVSQAAVFGKCGPQAPALKK